MSEGIGEFYRTLQEWQDRERELLAANVAMREELRSVQDSLIRETRARTEKPDFETYVRMKTGTVGDILWMLQNGEISRSKACEALAELAHGLEPRLPEVSVEAIPEDAIPGEVWRELEDMKSAARPLSNFIFEFQHWSLAQFGHGDLFESICRHIEKELIEIRENPLDRVEWVDVVLLAVDGWLRAGGAPEGLLDALRAKHSVNLARVWGKPNGNEAIEHVREAENHSPAGVWLCPNCGDVQQDQNLGWAWDGEIWQHGCGLPYGQHVTQDLGKASE